MVFVVACSDDEDVFTPRSDSGFKNLTAKDDVLHNLELAYNLPDIEEFRKLLDDEFIFFFSLLDAGTGDIPISWEKPDEILTTTNLFNKNLPGPLRVTNIDLRLTCVEDDWKEIPQGDEDSWYSMEVVYHITVQTVSGIDYKGNNLKAQFIVREAIPEGESKKIWRIIRWRDIGEGDAYRSFDIPASSAVDAETWGVIKELYK
jgi:hypothetical protein